MITTDKMRSSSNPQDAVLEQQLPAVQTGETASTVLAAQAVAVIQARTSLAAARPRDLDVVREKVLKECRRPGFADAAIYHKPIGDGVEGLSIRFVEAALRCMGNVSQDTATIFDDEKRRMVRVTVSDLESNVTYTIDITLRKVVDRSRIKDGDVLVSQRLNSKGYKVYTIEATDDEILDKQNALISKAVRTQGLRVIPGDIQDEAKALCYRVLDDRAAKDPDGERRKIFDSFNTVGVTVEQLKTYLGHDGSTLNPKEISTLRGLFAAVREGETSWRDIMESRASASPKSPAATTETQANASPAATTRVEKTSEPPPAVVKKTVEEEFAIEPTKAAAEAPAAKYDPATGEVAEREAERVTYGEMLHSIKNSAEAAKASGVPEWQYLDTTVRPLIDDLADDGHRSAVTSMLNNKVNKLKSQQTRNIE